MIVSTELDAEERLLNLVTSNYPIISDYHSVWRTVMIDFGKRVNITKTNVENNTPYMLCLDFLENVIATSSDADYINVSKFVVGRCLNIIKHQLKIKESNE
jgi:hypothetical protein